VIANQWNYVTIDQSLIIDGKKDILISLEISACAGTPAGYSQWPSTASYSDLFFMDGAWISMLELGYNSGIYYAVMESAGGVKMTKKMMLIK